MVVVAITLLFIYSIVVINYNNMMYLFILNLACSIQQRRSSNDGIPYSAITIIIFNFFAFFSFIQAQMLTSTMENVLTVQNSVLGYELKMLTSQWNMWSKNQQQQYKRIKWNKIIIFLSS